MTDLSPAAQAVLDAAETGLDGYIELLPPTWKSSVAAALRAAGSQFFTDWDATRCCVFLDAIADELEGTTDEELIDPELEKAAANVESQLFPWRDRDAALTVLEPERPSDDEIYKLALEGDFLVDAGDGFSCLVQDEVEFARAVLARWGK